MQICGGRTYLFRVIIAESACRVGEKLMPETSNKPKILIIEDDEMTALVERSTLEVAGYRVDDVREGYVGLDRLQGTDYDLVVLDYMLPDLRGDEVLERIGRERLARLPVLVVTGYNDPVLAARLKESGASGFLAKDSSMIFLDELPRQVAALMARAASQSDAALQPGGSDGE